MKIVSKHPVTFQVWTIVTLAIAIISSAVTFTTMYKDIDARIWQHEVDEIRIIWVLNDHEDRISETENSNARIETDLSRIKAALLRIEKNMK